MGMLCAFQDGDNEEFQEGPVFIYSSTSQWMVYVCLVALVARLYIYIYIYFNNNNSNLILRSRPSQTPNWCMRPPCLSDKGPPPCSDLTAKVYRGIHILAGKNFKPWKI
jgi:hypothetical protein